MRGPPQTYSSSTCTAVDAIARGDIQTSVDIQVGDNDGPERPAELVVQILELAVLVDEVRQREMNRRGERSAAVRPVARATVLRDGCRTTRSSLPSPLTSATVTAAADGPAPRSTGARIPGAVAGAQHGRRRVGCTFLRQQIGNAVAVQVGGAPDHRARGRVDGRFRPGNRRCRRRRRSGCCRLRCRRRRCPRRRPRSTSR